ncbi:MAG: hemerythrin domain-containing protein [Actinomycetia bacterium]|nr:hemerythrin domain-containing protein [Actinomycetes bacterium]
MADNAAVAQAIARHHAEMVQQLSTLTEQLTHVIRHGDAWQDVRDQIQGYADRELLPHAAAEESTLYARGRDDATLIPLIESLLAEHRALRRWRNRLVEALDAAEALLAAGALRALFTEHAGKEESWLLPGLVRRDVDLETALGAMRSALAGS